VEGITTDSAGALAGRPADLPRGTLTRLFLDAVDEWDKPDALLIDRGSEWSPQSHRALLETVRHLASGLRQLGVERGDRVALLSENRAEWAWTDFAILCAGALNVPLYPTLPAAQASWIVEHSGAKIAFVSTRAQLDKMLEARPEALRTLVVFDDVAEANPSVLTLAALLELGAAADPGENEFRREALVAEPDDVATVIYTSGTTGTPKGVLLTHDNLYSNVIAALAGFDIGPADIELSFLPLSHVLQRMVDYAMVNRGCTIAHVKSIDEVGAAFRSVRPTVAVGVPRIFEKLYARILAVHGPRRHLVFRARAIALGWAGRQLAGTRIRAGLRFAHALADRLVFSKIRASLGGRMRIFISGGAPLAPQLARFFYGVGLPVYEGYGLTETSPVTHVNTPSHLRTGTVGLPIRGTDVRIAEDGEILIRGPQVMKGYYHNPEATAAALRADGWFFTGDIGEIDADGYLRITDRKKDLLKTAGGKFVAPQPIENAAKLSRYVSEAILIADRRPYPVLIVVPNFENLMVWAQKRGLSWTDMESLISLSAVQDKLDREVARRVESFARFEQPKKVIALPRELSIENSEITPKLNVKRRVIEERFSDRIEAAYGKPRADDA
jgi:long-chain acyl-CoA synthetase